MRESVGTQVVGVRMWILGGVSPSRKTFLLSIAHSVVGKYISGTRGVPEVETDPRTQL